MKIVTVNVPESYIDAINKLIGVDGQVSPHFEPIILNKVDTNHQDLSLS